jgi:predicted lipoprotein with Yx(FWY)xxD motif
MAVNIVAAAAFTSLFLLAGAAQADHHAVKTATKEQLGSYLTDAKGMTLYVFKKDSMGKSACAGDCVTRWPLYYREKPVVTGSLRAEDFGTIARDDGQKQTTYKGLPLYYFAGDTKQGDVNGQGVRDVWFVAVP